MKILISFLLFSFCLLAISAQEKPVAEIILNVDLEKKKVSFPVQFLSSDQLLEVFACTEQGPTHETVLLIQPIGIKLHEALKQFGLTEALHWQYPLEDGFQLTMGDKVMMKIYFEGKTEADAIYVEDLLVYNYTDTPSFLRGWSFKGDQVTVDGKVSPMSDVEFSLINKGRNKSPLTLLLNPSNFVMIDEPEYKVASKYKPLLKKMNDPEKTKGTIVVVPVTEEFLATENAKRYADKDGFLVKNIEIAKKIDVMKKKFQSETRKALAETIEKGSVEGISEADKKVLIQKHQSLALMASRDLYEIHYLYHQMAKNEYEYLWKVMQASPEDSANKAGKAEAAKTFKFFAYELIGYLTKEKGFRFQAKLEESLAFEAKITNNTKEQKEHEVKSTINLINAEIQDMAFRQITGADQIETDTKKLKEPEIANSKVMKDTFEKSVNKAILEKNFFKGIENYYQKKVLFLQDTIKEGADVNKSGVIAKVSLLEAVNLKFAILEYAHKERLKLLDEYMKEDKKETDYYKKKISETEDLLKNVLKAISDIKKIIDDKAPGVTLEDLEKNYQEHLSVK